MSKDHVSQVTLLGVTFMAIAGITDALYALLAGHPVRSSRRGERGCCRGCPAASWSAAASGWLALTRAR
jgi:hypothetical protein